MSGGVWCCGVELRGLGCLCKEWGGILLAYSFFMFLVVLMFHFRVWESLPNLVFCCLLGVLMLVSYVVG